MNWHSFSNIKVRNLLKLNSFPLIKHLLWILLIALSLPVTGQTTDFTFSGNNGVCLPANIQFTQTSSGTPKGFLWDFGNGTKSNQPNPIATYTSPGAYTVRLITVYENNTAQRTRTIIVHPSITAAFTSDMNFVCQPGTANFTATSTGNLGFYTWDFGDGSPMINGNANNISHTYSGYGDFTVTLKATSNTGCVVTSTRNIKIARPEITGSILTPMKGCVPMNTVFRAQVTVPPGTNVTNYSWEFGDGNTINTSTSQVSHVFTGAGAYSAKLTVTTGEGCSNIYNYDTLYFGIPPSNESAFPVQLEYCGSETPQFISHATNANQYDWDFGGGGIVSVHDTLAEHRYSNLGPKNITVTPVYNGCAGTPVQFTINIIGVIARFNYHNTCEDKKTFLFQNNSQGNMSTIHWSLGNQAYSSNPDTVSHTYPQSGTFGVKLLITDNITGCVDSFKTRIFTANPRMKNDAQSICINSDTKFTMQNNYANPSLLYTWNVLGDLVGPGAEAAPIIHADSLGQFGNSVILDNGPQYCADTIQLDHIITVRGPKLDFSAPVSLCVNTALNVVNLSHPYQPADTIQQWTWNFGFPSAISNEFQPQPFQYSVPKIYTVQLTATDITGCTDSLSKKVYVRPMPFLWIIPRQATICSGQGADVVGYTSDDILWTPGNTTTCSTCDTTSLRPVQSTVYYATSTNSFNCVSSDSVSVNVFAPFTARPNIPDTAFCSGKSVQLDVQPNDKLISWSPTTGLSDPHSFSPVASPAQSTVYTATVTDAAGCFSSVANINIKVKSIPVVDAGPDKAYPYHSQFSFAPTYSPNVIGWFWSPADSLNCVNCPNPITYATSTKTYTLKVVSDSGCVSQDRVTIFVECNGASLLCPKAFTPNNDGRNDVYRPITRGINMIKRFAIFNRQGQLLFELHNYVPGEKDNIGWDGKYFGQPAAPAAYVYFIEAVCDMGQTITDKGSFVLIR